MNKIYKLRYLIGFSLFICLSGPASAMPISIANSSFDWLSFAIDGDVTISTPELESDLFVSAAGSDASSFGNGDTFFSDSLSNGNQFTFAGNDGDDFLVTNSLSTPAATEFGTGTAVSGLYSIVPFINNSFGDIAVSIDYEIFGLASVDSSADFSLASASAELGIFDEFFNEIDFIGNDVFVDTLAGSPASNEVVDYFDLFISELSAGNYYAVLSNTAISITEVAQVVSVPEPASLILVLLGLFVLSITTKRTTQSCNHLV